MIGIALLLAPAFTLAPAPQATQTEPPGMVRVAGQKTTVGTPPNVIEELIPANEDLRGYLAAETPQIQVEVEDFWLAPTEVTNEQYALFVRAAGVKPPAAWGAEAVDVARREYLEAQGAERRAAFERGQRPPASRPFDVEAWWDAHWTESDWKVPADQLDQPVVYVDYYRADAFTRWAGLRLMTEFEFYCAARGASDKRYPWGDDWAPGRCVGLETGVSATLPVARYPGGAVDGIHDLSGNVWEWTSSPFVEFKGYKPLRVKVGSGKQARTLDGLAPFDPNQRVTVGGCFSSPPLALRVATRFGADRTQSTEGLGFRCAASLVPGLDAANALLANSVRLNVLPDGTEFYAPGVAALQRWRLGEANEKIKARVRDYAVIAGYEALVFVPTLELASTSTRDLTEQSVRNGPLVLGFVSLTRPMVEPALEPGLYYVAWRGVGRLLEEAAARDESDARDAEEAAATDDGSTAFATARGFDPEKEQVIFFDAEGAPVAAMDVAPVSYDKMGTNRMAIEPWVPLTPAQLRRLGRAEPPTPVDTLAIDVAVAGKQRGKGFALRLPLRMAQGAW